MVPSQSADLPLKFAVNAALNPAHLAVEHTITINSLRETVAIVNAANYCLCHLSGINENGAEHYNLSYPGGPRAMPAVSEGKVYVIGAEGDLLCLEAKTGALLWSKDLQKEYRIESPMWGFSAHPLVMDNTLYGVVGTAGWGRGILAELVKLSTKRRASLTSA